MKIPTQFWAPRCTWLFINTMYRPPLFWFSVAVTSTYRCAPALRQLVIFGRLTVVIKMLVKSFGSKTSFYAACIDYHGAFCYTDRSDRFRNRENQHSSKENKQNKQTTSKVLKITLFIKIHKKIVPFSSSTAYQWRNGLSWRNELQWQFYGKDISEDSSSGSPYLWQGWPKPISRGSAEEVYLVSNWKLREVVSVRSTRWFLRQK